MNKYHNMTYDNKHISGGERVEITVSHVERVFSLGSSDYDRLIEFIAIRKGII